MKCPEGAKRIGDADILGGLVAAGLTQYSNLGVVFYFWRPTDRFFFCRAGSVAVFIGAAISPQPPRCGGQPQAVWQTATPVLSNK